MDWRLIAAVSAAAGSFCFVAVGAYVVLSHSPAPQQTFASAPMLLSENRFPVAATPSLLSSQPASPSLFAPGLFAPSPFAPQGSSVSTAVTSGGGAGRGRRGARWGTGPPPSRHPTPPLGRSRHCGRWSRSGKARWRRSFIPHFRLPTTAEC